MGELTFRCSSHPHFAREGDSLLCIGQTHKTQQGMVLFFVVDIIVFDKYGLYLFIRKIPIIPAGKMGF